MVRSLPGLGELPLHVTAYGRNTSNLLMCLTMAHSLGKAIVYGFQEWINLVNCPKTREEQADYLNIDRFCSLRTIRTILAVAHPKLVIQESQSE